MMTKRCGIALPTRYSEMAPAETEHEAGFNGKKFCLIGLMAVACGVLTFELMLAAGEAISVKTGSTVMGYFPTYTADGMHFVENPSVTYCWATVLPAMKNAALLGTGMGALGGLTWGIPLACSDGPVLKSVP